MSYPYSQQMTQYSIPVNTMFLYPILNSVNKCHSYIECIREFFQNFCVMKLFAFCLYFSPVTCLIIATVNEISGPEWWTFSSFASIDLNFMKFASCWILNINPIFFIYDEVWSPLKLFQFLIPPILLYPSLSLYNKTFVRLFLDYHGYYCSWRTVVRSMISKKRDNPR